MGQKKGHRNKASKGEVSITNSEGVIRLRWRFQGQRYSLNLNYPYTDYNLPKAAITAAQIKLDMIQGAFDPTLAKYRDKGQKVKAPQEKVQTIAPENENNAPKYPLLLAELVDYFRQWAKSIRNVDITKSPKYENLLGLLAKLGDQPIESFPVLLGGKKWAPSTYNGRLGYFKIFLEYLLKKGKIKDNPLDEVTRKRGKKGFNPKREPLTEVEILKFLDAIKSDKYTHSSSPTAHSFYYPFFYFIFSTGVRNAEAIGLRVKHINAEKKQVEISETMARTSKGSHHAARVRKGTKTENARYLPLSEELLAVLLEQIKGKHPDDLVFPSPRGLCINDHLLQQRIFKPVMKLLGFGDKDLYVARHSFGTRAIEQGMAPTGAAYLMGHSSVETTLRNYVSVRKAPDSLPKINRKQ